MCGSNTGCIFMCFTMTFVVDAYVVLRQPEIGELVFGVPAPWQRRVVLVHHRVQALQPVLALLAERAGRVAVGGRRTAANGRAAAVVRVHHGRVVAAVVRAGRHLYRRRSRRVVLFLSEHGTRTSAEDEPKMTTIGWVGGGERRVT